MGWHQNDERGGGKSTSSRELFSGVGSKRFFFEKKKQKTFVCKG
jgi:hypothetical protein